MFMPFQILGAFFRLLLTIALLAGGSYLLVEWNNHRVMPVEVTVEKANPPADQAEPPAVHTRQEVRMVSWHFGFNKPTAELLGGLFLLGWSLFGWAFPAVLFRRGGDDPRRGSAKPASVQRLRRPDGSELHVETYGPDDGPVLVLTHGWSLTCDEWVYTRNQLARGYRLITWDLPGLGRSSGPVDRDWSVERMAADLDAVVALAGNRPVVLVGHSIGGMILLTYCRLFAAKLGTQVRGLVIAHSTYTNPVKTASLAPLYTALQKPVLEPMCWLMIRLSGLFYLMDWLSYLNGSAQRSTERSSFSGRESRWQLNSLTRLWVPNSPAVFARGFLNMFRYDATATLDGIPVPVLLVAGDRDPLCVPQASAYMAERMPAARLVVLPDSRHCGLYEHYGHFHETLDSFASQCLPPGQAQEIVSPAPVGVVNQR